MSAPDHNAAAEAALRRLDGSALFVLVGAGDADREALKRWIAGVRGASSFAFVDTAREDEMRHEGLGALSAAADDLIIAPVGVVRAPGNDAKGAARLLKTLTTAPQLPGRRARSFEREPHLWVRLVGEKGSAGELRRRFAALGEDPRNAAGFADFVARQSVVTIERERRKLPGARVKLPRLVVPAIMARPDFEAELNAYASASGEPAGEVFKRARACLVELAPAPAQTFVSMMSWLTQTICSLGYDPKMIYDEARAREVDTLVRTAPTAFLFTHKTHVDGMAMMNYAFERELPLLHVIGGINMAFAGMGTLAKKSGAVFIRRSFQDDAVYKIAIRHYLAYVMEKRFPLAWSLEGTRSRLGKLMPPRYGILKYVLEAANRRGIDDLKIIPVSIHYDLIPEIASYESEQAGATKTRESLAWFIGFVAGMRKPLGRIFMDFGEPVSIAGRVAAEEAEGEDAFSIALRKIAFEAAVNINNATPLTSSGAISFIMMSAAPQALTETEIARDLMAIRSFATSRALPMTHDFLDANTRNVRDVARAMIDVGVLARHDDGVETVYGVAPGQHFTASYYRNTVAHLFVRNAIIELALADAMDSAPGASEADFWRGVRTLRDLFKFEFFYSPSDDFRREVSDELDRQAPHWRLKINAGGKAAGELLETMTPLFAPGVLKPLADGYSVVADALVRLKDGDGVEEKDVVSICLKLGREAVLRQKIAGSESIAKFLYANGFQLARQRGLLDGDAAALAGARLAFAREIKAVQARIRLVESIAARRRAAHDLGLVAVAPAETDEKRAQGT